MSWGAAENERLRRCWRGLMRGWALRWKVIRGESKEREEAALCLQEALKCRERARI